MPFYHSLGFIPAKRHTVNRKPDGGIYQEELVGTQGFGGLSSLVYHLYPPTRVKQKGKPYSVKPAIAIENGLNAMSFSGYDVKPEKDFLESRKNTFCQQ